MSKAASPARERESLKDEVQLAMEEARMVLPGIQSLFGFQLIAVFNERFERLPETGQHVHLTALALVAVSIALVMAPAAYHRIGERGWVSRHLSDITSDFLSLGMVALMLVLTLEVGLVFFLLLHSVAWSVLGACAALLLFTSLWFLLPLRYRLLARRRRLD
jgi:hypothetical protein